MVFQADFPKQYQINQENFTSPFPSRSNQTVCLWPWCTPEDLQLSLLDVESNFYIKYDTASNKLLDVSLEAI